MSSAPSSDLRIRGAILGLAVCDALGAPVEFKPRGSFSLLTEMMPNNTFGTPEGAFTDDTSQTLCLAHSLLDNEGKHNSVDQVEKYLAWRSRGYMSSVGQCFDIGVSTNTCLSRWDSLLTTENDRLQPGSPAAEVAFFNIQNKIKAEFNREQFCGNGSLMRVLSVALISLDIHQVADLAVQSSLTTHPHTRCTSACVLYTKLVCLAMQGGSQSIDLASLATMLAEIIASPTDSTEIVLKTRLLPYKSIQDWRSKNSFEIRSTGYVVDSLEASLWAFFTTRTFEEGAITVVNLGDDADTVGAIYGGLAGAFYGFNAIPIRWLEKMKRMDLLDDVVAKILKYREKSTEGTNLHQLPVDNGSNSTSKM